MRVIFIYGKKVTIILTVILFMIVIFLFERGFHDGLKLASLNEVNIFGFTEYADEDNRVTYKLPESWSNKEKEYDFGKMVYHSEFYDTKNSIGGYIQLFNKEGVLQDVIGPLIEEQSKDQEYNYRPIKVNGYNGYKVMYQVQSSNEQSRIKFLRYYIDGEKDRVIMTFYISSLDYKEELDKVFQAVTESIEVR